MLIRNARKPQCLFTSGKTNAYLLNFIYAHIFPCIKSYGVKLVSVLPPFWSWSWLYSSPVFPLTCAVLKKNEGIVFCCRQIQRRTIATVRSRKGVKEIIARKKIRQVKLGRRRQGKGNRHWLWRQEKLGGKWG